MSGLQETTDILGSQDRSLSTPSTVKSSFLCATPMGSNVGSALGLSTSRKQTRPGTEYLNKSWVSLIRLNSKPGFKPVNSFIKEDQYLTVPKWLRSRPKLIHSCYYRQFFSGFVYDESGVDVWMKGAFRSLKDVICLLKDNPDEFDIPTCHMCNKRGTVCLCYYPEVSMCMKLNNDLKSVMSDWYANPTSMHKAYAKKMEEQKAAASRPKVHKVYLTASQKRELKAQRLLEKKKKKTSQAEPQGDLPKSTDGLTSPEVGSDKQNQGVAPVQVDRPAKSDHPPQEELGFASFSCPKAGVRAELLSNRPPGGISVGFPVYKNRFSLAYAACHSRLHDLTHAFCKQIHLISDSLSSSARSKALGLLQSTRVLWDPYTGLRGIKYAESHPWPESKNVGVSSYVSMTVRQLSKSA